MTGDASYTAAYTQIDYTITFDVGAHGSSTDTLVFPVHYGDTFPTAPAITAEAGWTFDGWPTLPATVTGDASYTATYTQIDYAITFDVGAHGSSTDTLVFPVHYGDYFPVAPSITAAAGWTFDGWPMLPATVTGDASYTATYTQIDYTVTFNVGTHGSSTDTLVFPVHYGDTFPTAPAITAAAGWTFDGWPTLPATVTGDASYTATYTQIDYTVTFDVGAHGSSTDTLVFPVHYGDTFPTAPAITVDAGWTFNGWPTLPATVTGDATYTATYTQIDYTVTFDVGAHGSSTDTLVFPVHYGDTFPTAPAITAEAGWTFDGWPTLPTTVTGDATYTATYTQIDYTVTFDVGAHGSSSDTLVFPVHYGDTFPTAPGITAEAGWTFDGWPTLPATVTGDASYTATYTQIDYTVTFDVGAHGSSTDTLVFPVHYGDTFPTAPSITADAGWTFDGWPTLPATVTGDASYTATYTQIDYTVTFNVGAHGSSTDTLVFPVHYGDTFPTAPAITAEAGWTFDGWPTLPTTVTGDASYTAAYTQKTFLVRFFRADGVTQIGTTQTVIWGQAAAPETAPGRAGATFAGWVLTGDDTSVTTSLTDVRENIDAVASYDANVYVVRFEDYDGTLLGTDQVRYGEDAVPPVDPTREGYDFTGWSPSYEGITGSLTVTAQYDIKTFTVTFVDYDGTVLSTQTVEWNTPATPPDVPGRDDYTFTGWDQSFENVKSDLTVTAQYEQNAEPSPGPTEIIDEPPVTGGGNGSWLWWLLLIPALGILIWLLLAWLTIVPIAEAVTDNGDGTKTIQWGYENRKLKKKKLDEQDSELTALSGQIIRNSQNPPYEFEKGRAENVFTTVATADAKVQWKIRRRKATVDLAKKNK